MDSRTPRGSPETSSASFKPQEIIMTTQAITNRKLLAAALIVASAFSAAYSAESSAADAFLRKTTASTNLSADGSPVTIKQVTIPAGTWLVTAKANPVNFGPADYVR